MCDANMTAGVGTVTSTPCDLDRERLDIKRRALQGQLAGANARIRELENVADADRLFGARLCKDRVEAELRRIEGRLNTVGEDFLAFVSHTSKVRGVSSSSRGQGTKRGAGEVCDDDDDFQQRVRPRLMNFHVEGCNNNSNDDAVSGSRGPVSMALNTAVKMGGVPSEGSGMGIIHRAMMGSSSAQFQDTQCQRADIVRQILCPHCGSASTVISHESGYKQCNACGVKERYTDATIDAFPFGTDVDTSVHYQRKSHLGGLLKNSKALSLLDPDRLRMFEFCFQKAEEAFVKNRAKTGRNNFTYMPTNRMIAVLLGYDDLVKHFPPLKTEDKREKAAELLKIICDENGWEYFDSDVMGREW